MIFDLSDLDEFRFGIEKLHSVVWYRKIADDGLGSILTYSKWNLTAET